MIPPPLKSFLQPCSHADYSEPLDISLCQRWRVASNSFGRTKEQKRQSTAASVEIVAGLTARETVVFWMVFLETDRLRTILSDICRCTQAETWSGDAELHWPLISPQERSTAQQYCRQPEKARDRILTLVKLDGGANKEKFWHRGFQKPFNVLPV